MNSLKRELHFYKLIENNKSDTPNKRNRALLATGRDKQISVAFTDVMNSHIFPYVKFAASDDLKSIMEDSIGDRIMKQLRIPINQRAAYWAGKYALAEQKLVSHRTLTQQKMKKKCLKRKFYILTINFFSLC